MTDQALRTALSQQNQASTPRLPSNFASLTLRRIERRKAARERREQLVAVVTTTLCCLLGVGAIIGLYGDALLQALTSAAAQPTGLTLLPTAVVSAVVLALLNTFLRRRLT